MLVWETQMPRPGYATPILLHVGSFPHAIELTQPDARVLLARLVYQSHSTSESHWRSYGSGSSWDHIYCFLNPYISLGRRLDVCVYGLVRRQGNLIFCRI